MTKTTMLCAKDDEQRYGEAVRAAKPERGELRIGPNFERELPPYSVTVLAFLKRCRNGAYEIMGAMNSKGAFQ